MGPGTIVGEKYYLERVIGRGGMGMVVEARHLQLGTTVALKFLSRTSAQSGSLNQRFLREARATAALKSEHVCRVFDVGVFEGSPYLVMERLDGTDLAQELKRRGRIPAAEACGYVLQACAGIAEAHAAQIVHRDLKPGNLFRVMRPDGTPIVKVLDFGIAKVLHDDDEGGDLTGTNVVLGSPSYMSIEQLRSSKLVDARSDIWSLGVILYELVAGRKPFVGDGIADLALKIVMEETPRLPGGPVELDAVIARCLQREPAHRFADVAELAAALTPIASAGGWLPVAVSIPTPIPGVVHARPSVRDLPSREAATDLLVPPPSATTLQTAGAVLTEVPQPWLSRGRTRQFGALVGLGLVGIVVAVALTDDGAPSTAAAGASDAAGMTAPAVAPPPATEAEPATPEPRKPAPAPEPAKPEAAPAPEPPRPDPATTEAAPAVATPAPAPPPKIAAPPVRPKVVAKPAPKRTPPPPVTLKRPKPPAAAPAKPEREPTDEELANSRL